MTRKRPNVLVTGVGRHVSIGTGIARQLAIDGWDVAFASYRPDAGFAQDFAAELEGLGARAVSIEADMADPASPESILRQARQSLGLIRGLVSSHALCVNSSIQDTSLESFDSHFAINTRANWLLIKAFADLYSDRHGDGRIVVLTSDHTTHNLPYGASKGALDRIVIAAATELSHLGITANLINPGPIDTGWMTADLAETVRSETAAGRLGTPQDTAHLASFLLSTNGAWINGQLLHSNGGFHLQS